MAKMSLHLDVRLAASPDGSIDSRLPTSSEEGSNNCEDVAAQHDKLASQTTPKHWRYSTAPRLIAESDLDVREPFPEGSPQLPDLLAKEVNHSRVLVAEPPSSGFTSPVNPATFTLKVNDEPGLTACQIESMLSEVSNEELDLSPSDHSSLAGLEQPMMELRVGGVAMDDDPMNESPDLNHLQKASADIGIDTGPLGTDSETPITLSAPAKAAADSAKLRRGNLSNLFPMPPAHNGTDGARLSPGSKDSEERATTPCPDPLLHERAPMVLCPDPGLHFRSCGTSPFGYQDASSSPSMHGTGKYQHGAHPPLSRPPMPFNRTTASGSPMPMLKVKPRILPSRDTRSHPHDTWQPPPNIHARPSHRQHDPLNRIYPSTATEHFEPGWYYARENPRSGPAMYSFSTAAAKVVGQDPAPDSRIRDSYRTDTLTPLAKPPNRFRKHGVIALASARGIGKYYGGPPFEPRPPHRQQQWPDGARFRHAARFRGSPPSSVTSSSQTQQVRKRSRELETPSSEITEDDLLKDESIDPKLRLEEDEDVIEIDEETRAAVRLSLYGALAPEAGPAARGLRELSPNVMPWRKGTQPLGRRKKRRPSYWDGDLEAVVRSPAARHVVSSPITKVDVKSEQGEVEFQQDPGSGETRVKEDASDGISIVAEGDPVLADDISMKS